MGFWVLRPKCCWWVFINAKMSSAPPGSSMFILPANPARAMNASNRSSVISGSVDCMNMRGYPLDRRRTSADEDMAQCRPSWSISLLSSSGCSNTTRSLATLALVLASRIAIITSAASILLSMSSATSCSDRCGGGSFVC